VIVSGPTSILWPHSSWVFSTLSVAPSVPVGASLILQVVIGLVLEEREAKLLQLVQREGLSEESVDFVLTDLVGSEVTPSQAYGLKLLPEGGFGQWVDNPSILADLQVNIQESNLHVHDLDELPLHIFGVVVRSHFATLHLQQLVILGGSRTPIPSTPFPYTRILLRPVLPKAWRQVVVAVGEEGLVES
jgi:hypothetical protein